MSHPPLLEMRGISKRFPGVVALDQVSRSIGEGAVIRNFNGRIDEFALIGRALTASEILNLKQ